MDRREFLRGVGLGAAALGLGRRGRAAGQASAAAGTASGRPNILWICAEDMSPHMGCYGETTIRTPNIDRLARQGTRFTRAFITCPVCSPSRSAVVTGMYQTSLGVHNHRSSRDAVKIRLPEHARLIPEYFQRAGYHTSNGGMIPAERGKKARFGKTDYNFVWDKKVYDGADWTGRRADQPFFAQLQLRGGKNRGAKVPDPVDPAKVKLPPYYPDHPVLRADWAKYLNSVIQTDIEVGRIVRRLADEGLLESTVIFFWTDHGISHVRDKQFLYEGGIHIPLIVRGPGIAAGGTCEELVEHIDIPPTSLRLAGIDVPKHLQGRDLFGATPPRTCAFSARDRCDETVERIRCVRTKRHKYIRNFFPHRPHAQPNRYKNHKQIMITMRQLFAAGKLTAAQARPFLPTRPVEELYDLAADPHELRNLAGSPAHRELLGELRAKLVEWMDRTGDLGEIPEPELNALAAACGTPWAVLQKPENRATVRRVRRAREAAERGRGAVGELVTALRDRAPAVRYQAAYGLGNLGAGAAAAEAALRGALKDTAASVRVAAARGVCKLGKPKEALPVLVKELRGAKNESVRHYAALALEDIAEAARPALETLKAARQDKHEYVRRVAARTVAILAGTYDPQAGSPRKRTPRAARKAP